MKYSICLLSGLFLITLLLFSGCSDDNPASPEETGPPELPPVSSMQMDASIFNQPGADKQLQGNSTNSNFNNAFLRAAFVKLIIDSRLIYPRALLQLADDVEPELNEDGEWIWSYSSQHNEETFGVRLVANSKDDGIYWAFYLSSSILGFENELLFDGITKNDGKQGTWYYYSFFDSNNQDADEALSKIEWLIESEDNISLTLTVISENGLGTKGDRIEYTQEGVIKTLDIYRAESDDTIIISWNADTKAGYIIAPDYNSGEKACWNSNFENTPCS